MRVLSLIFLLASVCAAAPSFHTKKEEARWGRIVEGSYSYQNARKINPAKVMWMVEGMDGELPRIYIGFDLGAQTRRTATLRIRKDGVVEREELRNDGQLIWVLDEQKEPNQPLQRNASTGPVSNFQSPARRG